MKDWLLRFTGVIGLDLKTVLGLQNIGRFFSERRQFLRMGGEVRRSYPILSDYSDWAGSMKGHYFHQDLYVAQKVFESGTKRHVDVGSSISGFVSHIASFMPIEILDIRPTPSRSKNISFTQQDVMAGLTIRTGSLSCLHTLEHFGLGRYGDPIDPTGHLKGFQNLVEAVEPNGIFYLSFPISSNERVEFNAHRVFHPLSPLTWPGAESLVLHDFAFVDDSGDFFPNSNVEEAVARNLHYGCGIYTFKKPIQKEFS